MTQPAFEIQRLVEFYETDMAGIVHFSNFFRFMESCEHAFIRSLDHHLHGLLDGLQTGWPRVSATCDYRAPACYGDLLTIRLFVAEVRPRSVRYRFQIVRDTTLIAEGAIAAAHVAITPTGIKAVPLPPALAQRLTALTSKI